jgi:3,4-dihydroxy-2-butanone 4-phosphate synthase
MPADGSVYILWVNQWHQIRNDSDEDRYHIIMDAYDTKRITNDFKYMGDINQLQWQANDYRKQIEATELTPEDLVYYENIRQKFVTKK